VEVCKRDVPEGVAAKHVSLVVEMFLGNGERGSGASAFRAAAHCQPAALVVGAPAMIEPFRHPGAEADRRLSVSASDREPVIIWKDLAEPAARFIFRWAVTLMCR